MGVFKKTKKHTPQKTPETKDEIVVKRCPECFVHLPLDAKECFACHAKLGKVDKYGKARKNTNWLSYIICILSWAFLFFYLKWAFAF